MISVAEALDRLFALVAPPVVEEVPLTEALGRVLARPVRASRAQPPFAASAMDGYAVRGTEVRPGARLRVVGESAAGRRFPGSVGPAQAVRILTGAPLPDGADAVVMQEDVEVAGDGVTLRADARFGHVRDAGSDFEVGALLAAPRRLRPADIALIAAFGHATVAVARRPDVAILSTGDELVMPGEAAGEDQIAASNAFGLAALIVAAGARPRILPIAPDTPDGMAFAFALAEGADLVLTIGGASVGDHDLVAPSARTAGATIAFHTVAMRPGKPLLAGRFGSGSALLGLPGNPVSAMVCGSIFLAPMIAAMLGLPAAPAPRERAVLAGTLPANGPREHYLRGRQGTAGQVGALARQDSSLLSVLSEADCLIVQPPHDPPRSAGAEVEIVRL